MSNPQDPYGQPDPYGQQGQPGYGQQYPQQGYQYGEQQGYEQQQYSGGYAATPARKPVELHRIVNIAAFVVLGLFVLQFLYILSKDSFGEFSDRFFGNLGFLGTGIFYCLVLLGLSGWLRARADD